jgi:hypothetical protein
LASVLAIAELMRAMVVFLVAPIMLPVASWTCSRSGRLGAVPNTPAPGEQQTRHSTDPLHPVHSRDVGRIRGPERTGCARRSSLSQ